MADKTIDKVRDKVMEQGTQEGMMKRSQVCLMVVFFMGMAFLISSCQNTFMDEEQELAEMATGHDDPDATRLEGPDNVPVEYPIILRQSSTGDTVTLPVGKTLKVVLQEKLTSNARWRLDEADDRILTLVRSDYQNAGGAAVSSSGEKYFLFKAVGAGRSWIKIHLMDGNHEADPPMVFEVLVLVTKEKGK